MVHVAENVHAEHSRLLKAIRLADILGPIIQSTLEGDSSMTVAQCAQQCLDDDMWLAADVKVKERFPRKSPAKVPSIATKAMTIALLEERYENDVPRVAVTAQERVDKLFNADDRHDMAKVSPLEQQMYDDDPFEGIPDPATSPAPGERSYR